MFWEICPSLVSVGVLSGSSGAECWFGKMELRVGSSERVSEEVDGGVGEGGEDVGGRSEESVRAWFSEELSSSVGS